MNVYVIMLDLRIESIEKYTKTIMKDCPEIKNCEYVPKPPGTEHYLLLAALSMQLKNKTILDFGTYRGNSAYMLAYGNRKLNNNNNIITYDITDVYKELVDTANVDYRFDNMFDPVVREENKEFLLSSDVMLIDIDPHEGILEYDMYNWLKENNYKGIIIYDDIHLGPGHMGTKSSRSMKEFWSKVDDKYKIDLTSVGHWTGTGVVCFNVEKCEIVY